MFCTKNAHVYQVCLLLYPFFVLFCPPLNFGIFYARIDEILILLCVPMVLADLRAQTNYTYKTFRGKLVKPYVFLFLLFCWGIIWGNSFGNLNSSYIRYILKPLYLILAAFAFKSMLTRAKINKPLVLISMLSAICSAGLLGYYAMYNYGLSIKLIQLYMPDLLYNRFLHSSFNMSVRAMSVFYGYDQASVTYAMGCIFIIALVICIQKNAKYKLLLILFAFILLGSIVSSARIGFVSFLGGALIMLTLPRKKRLSSSLLIIFIVLIFFVLLPNIGVLFPENKTLERFSDVLRIFSAETSTPFIERSEGLHGVIESQLLNINYPDGVDIVFGFGDDTNFVSDIAYASIFVKYGLIGLLVTFYVFFVWMSSGIKMVSYGLRKKIPLESTISFFILPGLAALFLIAAMKGPLYFLSLKTGELVSMLLGLSLFEFEVILNRDNAQ